MQNNMLIIKTSEEESNLIIDRDKENNLFIKTINTRRLKYNASAFVIQRLINPAVNYD